MPNEATGVPSLTELLEPDQIQEGDALARAAGLSSKCFWAVTVALGLMRSRQVYGRTLSSCTKKNSKRRTRAA
jgi:hypothetical protein